MTLHLFLDLVRIVVVLYLETPEVELQSQVPVLVGVELLVQLFHSLPDELPHHFVEHVYELGEPVDDAVLVGRDVVLEQVRHELLRDLQQLQFLVYFLGVGFEEYVVDDVPGSVLDIGHTHHQPNGLLGALHDIIDLLEVWGGFLEVVLVIVGE